MLDGSVTSLMRTDKIAN